MTLFWHHFLQVYQNASVKLLLGTKKNVRQGYLLTRIILMAYCMKEFSISDSSPTDITCKTVKNTHARTYTWTNSLMTLCWCAFTRNLTPKLPKTAWDVTEKKKKSGRRVRLSSFPTYYASSNAILPEIRELVYLNLQNTTTIFQVSTICPCPLPELGACKIVGRNCNVIPIAHLPPISCLRSPASIHSSSSWVILPQFFRPPVRAQKFLQKKTYI